MYKVSPDSRQIVHMSQDVEEGKWGLYIVRADGIEAAVKLTPTLVGDKNVAEFQISPDNRHAIYQADQDADEVTELYATVLPQYEVSDIADTIRSVVRKSVASATLRKEQGRSLIALLDTALASQDNNQSCQSFLSLKRQVSAFITSTSLTNRVGMDLINSIDTIDIIVALLELDCRG
jgi:hypothetical protein